MPIFYSPEGNPEIWNEGEAPEGHLTQESWWNLHPEMKPEPPSIDAVRANKLGESMMSYNAAFSDIDKVYPLKEREGWPVQLEEARLVLAGVNDPAKVQTLQTMITVRGRGETLEQFANEIIANNSSYRSLYAYLTATQQKMYAEINALTTNEAIEAYVIDFTSPYGTK